MSSGSQELGGDGSTKKNKGKIKEGEEDHEQQQHGDSAVAEVREFT